MNELELFAGAGGGILGSQLLGHRCICAVEYDAYARSVLIARQNDGTFPPFPIWDDVRTFDGKSWRGFVDVVSGGFPCTDISSARSNSKANGKIKGLDGEKSGLWREMFRIIAEVEPKYVRVENSARLVSRGLDQVLRDLAALGFNAEWGSLSAGETGAPHERDRMWIVAAHPDRAQRERGELPSRAHQEYADFISSTWWQDQPAVQRVDNGVAYQSHRLKAIGNGQVPIVAATAWQVLTN